MTRERRGTFSVKDHLDTAALATEILLYDPSAPCIIPHLLAGITVLLTITLPSDYRPLSVWSIVIIIIIITIQFLIPLT
jgi:hypothetical protein